MPYKIFFNTEKPLDNNQGGRVLVFGSIPESLFPPVDPHHQGVLPRDFVNYFVGQTRFLITSAATQIRYISSFENMLPQYHIVIVPESHEEANNIVRNQGNFRDRNNFTIADNELNTAVDNISSHFNTKKDAITFFMLGRHKRAGELSPVMQLPDLAIETIVSHV